MHILAPHISCIVLPNEFQDAVDQGYNEIYVMTSSGILKHHKLRGQNRHVRLKVDKIPGYTEATINQEVNFLPNGKIPIALFDQIVAFFKQVMAVKKSELEAMAWICWNQEQGYHIVIPNQTVSKASASYDWSSLPAGTTIVADIHSHNTMPAFFSGTDNRDDQNAIGFSGVVGLINNNPPQTVWRFNYRDVKIDTTFDRLFEVPEREAVVPDPDWIGKVSSPSPVSYGKNGFPTSPRGRAEHLREYQFKPGHGGAQAPGRFQEQSQMRLGPQFQGRGLTPQDAISTEPDAHFRGEFWGMASLIGAGEEDERFAAADRALASISEDPSYSGGNRLGKTVSVLDEDGENAAQRESTQIDRLAAIDNPSYDEIAINHGTVVAEAFCDIDNAMAFLNGKDDLLKDLMKDMVQFMSSEGQVAFFRALFSELPSREQEQIQMNGL